MSIIMSNYKKLADQADVNKPENDAKIKFTRRDLMKLEPAKVVGCVNVGWNDTSNQGWMMVALADGSEVVLNLPFTKEAFLSSNESDIYEGFAPSAVQVKTLPKGSFRQMWDRDTKSNQWFEVLNDVTVIGAKKHLNKEDRIRITAEANAQFQAQFAKDSLGI
jgi:hypothetical protein